VFKTQSNDVAHILQVIVKRHRSLLCDFSSIYNLFVLLGRKAPFTHSLCDYLFLFRCWRYERNCSLHSWLGYYQYRCNVCSPHSNHHHSTSL